MNPLDWSGEQFLGAYVPFLLVMLFAAKAWQSMLNQPSEEPRPGELELDPYQVAVLERREGGVRAAVAALVHAGALKLEDGVLKAVAGPPARMLPFERAVYEAVAGSVGEVPELEKKLDGELDRLEEGLRRRGLLMSPEVAERYTKYPKALFLGGVLGLGLMKLMVGVSRE
ncbi:MAG TPA: TIGR04222 domain-containing membrane protein, partial [Archangium sp.]|nr:TIGR04222 domain-containing membrane protein [Archangium sp.]